MTISQRIFNVMEQKHLKQSDLAKYIGITSSFVIDWKKKGSIPSADKIVKISEFLNVSIDYLLGVSNEPNLKQLVSNDNIEISQLNVDETTSQLISLFKELSFKDKVEVMNLVIKLSDNVEKPL